MRFRTTIELGGRTATGFAVPDEVVEGLASGRRPVVTVTINGFAYRTTVARMGGRYMVPLSAENRAGCGVAAADEVDVRIELDTEPRVVVLPPDFAAALDQAGIRPAFDTMAYTHRKEWVRSIEDATTDATRRRRIDKALDAIKAR